MTVLGVDVGGTSIKGARVDPSGGIEATAVRPTPSGSADEVIAAIAAVVDELGLQDVAAVGVVVPGAVDDGRVRYAANLPLHDVELQAVLRSRLDLPVVLGHDVAAAAEAEAEALGATDLLFVALGTGVAAARVRDGVADRGATGQAGELGHVVVLPGGERCTCGNRGCVEVYASAASIARRYRELSGTATAEAQHVASLAETDRLAATVWHEAVDALAAGVTAAVMLLDPAEVVIGGGLSGAAEALLQPVRKAMAERFTWRTPPPLRLGLLGAAAGQHGAARLARRLANHDQKEQSA